VSTEGVPAAPRSDALETAVRRARADWRRFVAPAAVVLAVLVILVAGGLTTAEFLTVDNLLIIVRTASITGIVALGMTFVTLTGNFFSLSLEQTAAMCSIVFAEALAHGYGLWLALLLGLLASIGIGIGQGLVVAAGLNPIVTTLGAGAALYGLAAIATGNEVVNFSTTEADYLGRGRPLGIPTQSWAFLILTVVATFTLVRTRFGRQVYLVGANREAARASGLSVGRTTVIAFTLSALGAGIAGVFTAAQITQAPLTQFNGLNFDVIAAVLVGGTALQGGEGSALRSALGAIFIAMLGNFMLLRGTTFGVRTLVTGLIVIVATSAFHLLRTRGRRP
jgi:simple sugar transport system permease protein/ribose transport system permease protein